MDESPMKMQKEFYVQTLKFHIATAAVAGMLNLYLQ
jgi:hypothetical protein